MGVSFFSAYRYFSNDDLIYLGDGFLDWAMKNVVDKSVVDDDISSKLHFAVSRTGLCCVELPELVTAAHDALIIDPLPNILIDNGSCAYRFLVSRRMAKRLLNKYGDVRSVIFVYDIIKELKKY